MNISKFECIICLEQFSQMVDISALPCGHVFHQNCINMWINEEMNKIRAESEERSAECPNCRNNINLDKVVPKLILPIFDCEEGTENQSVSSRADQCLIAHYEQQNIKLEQNLAEKDELIKELEEKVERVRDYFRAFKINVLFISF